MQMNLRITTLLLITTSFLSLPSFASEREARGYGGMSECLSLSLDAALKDYSSKNTLSPIPQIVIEESKGSPSNGVDVQVTFNGKATYTVIASPTTTTDSTVLIGCTSATVTEIQSN